VRHIDTFVGKQARAASRVLTCILYLHARPRRFGGGVFRLFPIGGDDGPVEIEPEHDLAGAFPSLLAQEVTPVPCPGRGRPDFRYAVNIWVLRQPRDGKLASVT